MNLNIYSLLQQQKQTRRKVFYKPQLSTQIKYTQLIHPQFINDTKIMYMSSYDFICYDVDQQLMSLINRPLYNEKVKRNKDQHKNKSYNEDESYSNMNSIRNNKILNSKNMAKSNNSNNINKQKQSQQFLKVNFGYSDRQTTNDMFYLTKRTFTLLQQQPTLNNIHKIQTQHYQYILQYRSNTITLDHNQTVLVKSKKNKQKQYNSNNNDKNSKISIIMLKNNNMNKQNCSNKIIQDEGIVIQGFLGFEKQFIVKKQQNLIVFVAKKQVKNNNIESNNSKNRDKRQPEIKNNKNNKQIIQQPQEPQQSAQQQSISQQNQSFESSSLKNNSNPKTVNPINIEPTESIINFINLSQPSNKNFLFIHSYKHKYSIIYQFQQSIKQVFPLSKQKDYLICVGQKYVYLIKLTIVKIHNIMQSTDDLYGYEDKQSKEKNIRHKVKIDVEIIDKILVEFYIRNEKVYQNCHMNYNMKKNMMKKNNKYSMMLTKQINNDKRLSSVLSNANTHQKSSFFNKNNTNTNNSPMNNNKLSYTFSNNNNNQNNKNLCSSIKQSQVYQQIKTIKTLLKCSPFILSHNNNKLQFIFLLYSITKVQCNHEQKQILNIKYEGKIFMKEQDKMIEIQYEKQINLNVQSAILNQAMSRAAEIQYQMDSNQYISINTDSISNNSFNDKEKLNQLQMLKQLGGICSNKSLLLWQKNQPIMHELIFRIDNRASQMQDLSQPSNLSSQKCITNLSTHYVLEYRNKINLSLGFNLIRDVIISPNNNNFLILTYKLCHNNSDGQQEKVDNNHHHKNNNKNNKNKSQQHHPPHQQQFPHVCEQTYDIQDYLIFQYDLFSQLWSNDANIYLKNIYNSFRKRRVQQIIPYRMKNDFLILSGKRVHQLHRSLLDGILNFDLHPYGYFIAVSFGFNAKIYTIQHSMMNLIYTYNGQNIKKIKYSPNGTDLVIMSSKNIKILDAYSFSVKYILSQKHSQLNSLNFTNFSYTQKGNFFYLIQDNNSITILQSKSYSKINSIKHHSPTHTSLLTSNDKITQLIADEQQKFCMCLLQNGRIYIKYQQQVVVLNHECIYFYDDNMKIKTMHYDTRRKVLFCGLNNGCVRAHIWPIKNQIVYTFNTYSQFKFSYAQITVINTSHLVNTLYIGDINGNVSLSKFFIESQQKSNGEYRTNSFYISSPVTPLINMPKTQLQALQKCYNYVLSSSSISLNDSPQRLKLQYKLNQLLSRMGEQMAKYKKMFIISQ